MDSIIIDNYNLLYNISYKKDYATVNVYTHGIKRVKKYILFGKEIIKDNPKHLFSFDINVYLNKDKQKSVRKDVFTMKIKEKLKEFNKNFIR